MSNQSGWYRNQDGDVFHVHGQDMSDETIEALGAMAAAARKMVEDDPDAFYAQKEREHHANLDAIEAEAEEQQWFEENDDYGPYNAESEWEAQPCQHEGCTETGNPCWLLEYDKPEGHGDEPDMWYCDAHMHSAGFCRGCGTFWGGVESFDFGSGFCEHCETEFEEPDADDYYSDFDYYDDDFYYP